MGQVPGCDRGEAWVIGSVNYPVYGFGITRIKSTCLGASPYLITAKMEEDDADVNAADEFHCSAKKVYYYHNSATALSLPGSITMDLQRRTF